MREPKPCSVEGCDKPANVPGTVKDLCAAHYRRRKIYGDPLGAPPPRPTICSVEGCERPIKARGWCSLHWDRWYHHGSTDDRPFGNPKIKHCNGCDGVYPRDTDNFYVHRSTSDGLDAYCKPCARQRRLDHLSANRDRINARRRMDYAADPAAARETRRAWVQANPEKARDASRSQNARRRAAMFATEADVFSPLEIFDRDGWRCGICSKRIDPTFAYPDQRSVSLDHVVPLARGGSHTKANVQAAHLQCNLRKHCGGTDQLRLIG